MLIKTRPNKSLYRKKTLLTKNNDCVINQPLVFKKRIKLISMLEDDSVTVKQWYFDCDNFYIDVEKDDNGKYSVFFVNRLTNEYVWKDESDK